jgi:quinol monooxygenase YgiN
MSSANLRSERVITFITHMRVGSENAAAFESLMTDMCEKVREQEPEVLHYTFARSANDPTAYVVIEVYRDASAHAAHMETAWVKSSIPKSTLLVEKGTFDIRQYVSPGTEPVRRRFEPAG